MPPATLDANSSHAERVAFGVRRVLATKSVFFSTDKRIWLVGLTSYVATERLGGLERLGGISRNISSIISLVAVVVAFFGVRAIYRQTMTQINDTHTENKKWKTLEICAQYELNDKISDSEKNIFNVFSKECSDEVAYKNISRDAIVILNYLDGIAIGVGQGLYIEELARDHLKNIVEYHVSHLLKSPVKANFKDIDENDYLFLIDMHSKWARSQTYYKSEVEKLVRGRLEP